MEPEGRELPVHGAAERLALVLDDGPGGKVVRLAGSLDKTTVAVLAGALDALAPGKAHRSLTIDLEGIRSLDGAAIDLLLDAERSAELGGYDFAVTGLQASLASREIPAPPADPAPQYARQARQTL